MSQKLISWEEREEAKKNFDDKTYSTLGIIRTKTVFTGIRFMWLNSVFCLTVFNCES